MSEAIGVRAAWLFLFVLLGSTSAEQAGEKIAGEKIVDAHDDIDQINDAVLISDISVAGKTVECGLFIKPPLVIQPVAPFPAGSDWLQQMTISLVNRTNKPIVYGGVILRFMDTGDCQALPCVISNLAFGKMPAIDSYDGRTGKPLRFRHPDAPSITWNPGQTISIHVADYKDDIEHDLSDSMPPTSITKVKLSRGVFFFPDGMRWTLGYFGTPDPNHRGRFKDLPVDYFPGERGNNWPPGYRQ